VQDVVVLHELRGLSPAEVVFAYPGITLADVHAALAYDSARFLFGGMREAKTTEGIKVRDKLAGLESFDGVTGSLTLEKGKVTRRPVYVVRLEDGKKVVQPYEPKK